MMFKYALLALVALALAVLVVESRPESRGMRRPHLFGNRPGAIHHVLNRRGSSTGSPTRRPHGHSTTDRTGRPRSSAQPSSRHHRGSTTGRSSRSSPRPTSRRPRTFLEKLPFAKLFNL
ncbi:hypothetical protein M3Y99_01779900 [Aphelenchoides fujianensis]|nr:hypothetical protein M3Y99_01779900 [Aphelenchoides fujianensis]